MLDRFFIADSEIPANAIMAVDYDRTLLAVSYSMAALATFVAMTAMGRIDVSDAKSRLRGSLLAGAAFGVGVWSQSLLALIAIDFPVDHTHAPCLTALSLPLAFLLAWFVFRNVARDRLANKRPLLNALVLGLGIVAVFYVGVGAIQTSAELRYRPGLVAVSILVAVLAAGLTGILSKRSRTAPSRRLALRAAGSLTMAAAVCGMNVTGLRSAVFFPVANATPGSDHGHFALLVGVAAGCLLVIGVALVLLLQQFVEGRSSKGAPTWHYLYYLFAVFAISTGGISYYLNHLVVDLHEASAALGRKWSLNRNAMLDLGLIAQGINKAGNDVLRTRDLAETSASIARFLEKYNEKVDNSKTNTAVLLSDRRFTKSVGSSAASAARGLDEVGRLGVEAAALGTAIVERLAAGDDRQAAELVEKFNAHFSTQIARILNLTEEMGEILNRALAVQGGQVKQIRVGEYIVLSLISIMSIAAILYGWRITKKVKEDIDQRERSLSLNRNTREIQETYNKIKENEFDKGGINIYSKFIFENVLRQILMLTHSEFGFAGEVVQDDEGVPYLKIFAFSFLNTSNEEGFIRFRDQYFLPGMAFRNLDSLLGDALKTHKAVVENSPTKHPFYGKQLPPGHPTVETFLGIPAMSGDRMVGLVGVANAPGGYSVENAEIVQPIVSTLVAIIESLRANAARAMIEKKYAVLMNRVHAIVFTCSPEGKTLRNITGPFEDLTGFSPDEFSPGPVAVFKSLVHPKDLQATEESIRRQILDTGKYKVEYRIRCADGATKWVHEEGGFVREEAQPPTAIQGTIINITERKQYEDELSKYRANFQQAVDEQTKAMVEQAHQAQAAAKAKSEFLANMSHELRTPMHAILSFSEIGLNCIEEKGPQFTKNCLKNIQKSGKRLLRLLNDLLDLAKIESGRMEYKKETADFTAVIDHTLIELEPLMKERRIEVQTSIDATSTSAVFDQTRMVQVLVNLVSNAIKFSDPGTGIVLSLADATLSDGASALCCSVADEGPGIPQSELEAVFDKFIQSSKTRTGAGGTGLGLAICREIVHAHGGRIWAENAEPKGAILRFVFPVKPREVKTSANMQRELPKENSLLMG